MMHLLLPTLEGEKPPEGQEEVNRRVAEALNPREPGKGEGESRRSRRSSSWTRC